MKIFIGNLAIGVAPHDLFNLFSTYGCVSAAYVQPAEPGADATYGYVHMKDSNKSELALKALDKKMFMQHFITVSEALDQQASIAV